MVPIDIVSRLHRACIDTIALHIPLSAMAESRYKEQGRLKSSVDTYTGEVVYEQFLPSIIVGSYSCNASIREFETHRAKGDFAARKWPCKHYMRLELSLPKAMAGHNIYGGPRTDQLMDALWWLWGELDEPGSYPEDWLVERIDLSHSYELGGQDEIAAWFDANRNVTYPRRSVNLFFNGTGSARGMSALGRSSCVRIYDKGLEYARVREPLHVPTDTRRDRRRIADKVLRTEVGILSEKLQRDFDGYPTAGQLEADYLDVTERRAMSNMFGRQDRARVNQHAHDQSLIDRMTSALTVAVYLSDKAGLDMFHVTSAPQIRRARAELRAMGIRPGVPASQAFMPGRYEYLCQLEDDTVKQSLQDGCSWQLLRGVS